MSDAYVPTLDTSQLKSDYQQIGNYFDATYGLHDLLRERAVLLDKLIIAGNHHADPYYLRFDRETKAILTKTRAWIDDISLVFFKAADRSLILETQSAILSNHEVATHLTHLLSPSKARSPGFPLPSNLSIILKDTTAYLTSHQTDSSSPIPPAINPTQIAELTKELRGYELEKGEVITLLNLLPKEGDLGLLDCVVEECDERLKEDKQRELLEMVGKVVGGKKGQ